MLKVQMINKKLRLQRNILVGIFSVMMVSNGLLAIKLYSQEVITRLVPTIPEEQIIGSGFVNDAALKARAEQIIYLLFSMKKENVDVVSSSLLKQVDNAAVDEFKKQIDTLAEDIRTRNYRYVFTDIQGYEFDNYNFTARLAGYLETYLAGKQLASKRKEYLISFFNRNGVLTLKSFEEVKNDKTS